MSVRLIRITPDAEEIIAYCARVSSPHQDNPDYAKLLKYCLDHKHFSIFEMAHATVEIVTSRAISAQILRHKSFAYQEFSTRYAEVQKYVPFSARRQDVKNRQNSIDDMPLGLQQEWLQRQDDNWERAMQQYSWALSKGVAKEVARAVLPMQTETRLYMVGSIRSWIHYLDVRCSLDTQLEHRLIAEECKAILAKELPTIAEALGWEK